MDQCFIERYKYETKTRLVKQSVRKNSCESNYDYYSEKKIMKELETDFGVYLGMRNQKQRNGEYLENNFNMKTHSNEIQYLCEFKVKVIKSRYTMCQN